MNCRFWLPLAALLLLHSPAVHSADRCAKYLNIAIPKKDQPSADEKKNLGLCQADAEYYGFDSSDLMAEHSPNYVTARKCAFLAREAKSDRLATSILMMIYANGQGVARNLDLALRFVCESPLSDREKADWTETLEHARAQAPADHLDACERSFDQSLKTPCAIVHKHQAFALRKKKFNVLSAKFPAATREKFELLLKFASEFFAADARWKNPMHLTGESRLALVQTHEAVSWEQFEVWIDKLESEKRLHPSTESLAEVDERLNKRYREYKRALPPAEQPPLIRAEFLWVGYRDSFVDFAVLRYEPKDAVAWNAILSQKRLEELTF